MQMDEQDRLIERHEHNNIEPHQSMADFDEAEFLPYLASMDITDEEAREFLHSIWNICRSFIEMQTPPESWGPILGSIIDLPEEFQAAV